MYFGEGLVGLSWAFLHAGAHNVGGCFVGALDASTVQLMDKFYDELGKGVTPRRSFACGQAVAASQPGTS